MATYVTSPAGQKNLANSRTSIRRSFTVPSGGGSIEVDYSCSTESGFDFFRVMYGATTHLNASGEVAQTTLTISGLAAQTAEIRLEYEKDGSDNGGSDECVVYEIRVKNSGGSVVETHNFAGTSPPTGWTQVLNDGPGVPANGWTVTDTGGGGTTLTPSLFTNSQTFYGPTLTQALAPGLFTNPQAFYGPTLRQTLAPSLLTNSQSFFGPTLSQALAPALFGNAQTFYGPTVSVGGDTLLPSLFTNAQTFYGPTLRLTLGGAWWVNHPQFFSATLAVSAPPVLPSAAGVSLRRSGTPSVRNRGASRSNTSASVGASRPASAGVRRTSFLSAKLKG